MFWLNIQSLFVQLHMGTSNYQISVNFM